MSPELFVRNGCPEGLAVVRLPCMTQFPARSRRYAQEERNFAQSVLHKCSKVQSDLNDHGLFNVPGISSAHDRSFVSSEEVHLASESC